MRLRNMHSFFGNLSLSMLINFMLIKKKTCTSMRKPAANPTLPHFPPDTDTFYPGPSLSQSVSTYEVVDKLADICA